MIYFGCGSSGKCRFIVIPDPKHVSCHPNVHERLHPGRGPHTRHWYIIWANYNDQLAEVTQKCRLVRESYPKWPEIRLRIYNKLARCINLNMSNVQMSRNVKDQKIPLYNLGLGIIIVICPEYIHVAILQGGPRIQL